MARHAGRADRIAVVLLLALLLPAVARAQGSSLGLDPSIRAAGMGGVSGAVFWGGDVDPWSNPALLAYAHGLRYDWGSTQIAPDFVSDLNFRTHRVSYSDFGLGVNYGRYTLDFGSFVIADQSGNPVRFSGHETAQAFGAGASVAGLTRTIGLLSGHDLPAWLPYVDVAAGMNRKSVDLVMTPGLSESPSDHPIDWGVMARVSPLPAQAGRAVAFDLTFAHSVINAGDVSTGLFAFPPSRTTRNGGATRLSLAASPALVHALGWLGSPGRPAFSLGMGFDHEDTQSGGGGHSEDRWAIEADALGLLALRVGYIDDPEVDLQDTAYGVGVSLPVHEFGGARFDFASVPRGSDLERQKRFGVSAWLDPLVITHQMRGR